jgi:serine/threonine protein kinase
VHGANDAIEDAEIRVGRTLRGKWRLDRVIGVGGTAAVYGALHRNGSRVAVKVLHRSVASSRDQRARFQREGNVANSVGHPAVTAVYDDDVDEDGCPFLVMDLLEGQTLAARAAACGGTLEVFEVLDLTARLLDVLGAAHARGILHRDIKPQNLFLTTAGELKVLDFGIARLTDPALSSVTTEVGKLLGTPAFVPPEQARGRPDQMDPRSDLWAVGATMYTLLTGRYVHEAPTSTEQLGLAMMAGAPSLGRVMPTLPAPLIVLVDRALSYSREDRWPDAQAMREAVLWLLGHWEATPMGPLEVPAAWASGGSSSSGFENAGVLTGDPESDRSGQHRPRLRGVGPLLTLAAVVLLGALWRWTSIPSVPTRVLATSVATAPAAHLEGAPGLPSDRTSASEPGPNPSRPTPHAAATTATPTAPLRDGRPRTVKAPSEPPSAAPDPLAAPSRNPLDRRY